MDRFDETRLVGFIEAVFSLELDDRHWLMSVLSALVALSGPEQQCFGFFYDASNARDFRLWNVCTLGEVTEFEAALDVFRTAVEPDCASASNQGSRVKGPRASSTLCLESMLAELERVGWVDVFNFVKSSDRPRMGCLLMVRGRARELTPSPAEALLQRRLSDNLATAFRYRSRFAVSAQGTDERSKSDLRAPGPNSSGEGREPAALRAASAGIARRRVQASLLPSEGAPAQSQREGWRYTRSSLPQSIRGRLTFVDTFEAEGSRYIVAREDRTRAQGFTALTERERQIVVHATLGFTNKQIAYALGISDATVRVLMARAASRVGVRTRRELLAHPELPEVRIGASETGT